MADNKNNINSEPQTNSRFANDNNPWLGLGSYQEGQHLYGRDKETEELTDIIVNHTASVVYGKSGIGKSSLLRAGVFPRLRQNGLVPIYLRLSHNSAISYTRQIENAITENVVANDLLPEDIPDLGLWDFLHRHHFTDGKGNIITPVIVLDQFEEIFTLTEVEHKVDVQVLFTELADVLNDVKPDKVIEAETVYNQNTIKSQSKPDTSGFVLQSLSIATLKYERNPSFRFVFSLRDDSLFLLERNSAKIPAIKVNRYNLCALDESSALDVIMKPCPRFFSEKEGKNILDGLAYYEYDNYRLVDPAILSLFLYSYHKEQGKVSYENIFEKYYADSIQAVSASSISYIEDELLTDDGYRKRLPYKQLIGKGISPSEIENLEKCIILKQEKDYVEFSHDLLCKEALRHKSKRINERNKKKFRVLIGFFLAILGSILIAVWILWPEPPIEVVSLKLKIAAEKAFMSGEHWEVDFRFMSLSKDSVLMLPVQTPTGMPLERMKAFKGNQNEFQIIVPKEYLKKEKKIRIQFFNPSENCSARTDTIDLQQWAKIKTLELSIKRIKKIPFVGKVVTEEGLPLEKALVVLGNQPMQETKYDGVFSFLMDDSSSLNKDLYVFRQGYENEHILGALLAVCNKGTYNAPLIIPMKSNSSKASDVDFKKLFAEQLHATTSLFDLARKRDNDVFTHDDSIRLDSVIKVYPQYALNLKKLRITNKTTSDRTLVIHCVSVENSNIKGFRDAVGKYLLKDKYYVFKGKLLQSDFDGKPQWRLSAISWDKENNQYVIQGIIERITASDKKTFILEVLKPYSH